MIVLCLLTAVSHNSQDFYSLVCRAIHSHKDTDSEGLENNRTVTLPSMMPAVYLALSSNMGIQELVPYLSRYLFQQVGIAEYLLINVVHDVCSVIFLFLHV